MTYEELQKAFDLSDEVIESYKKYAALLKEWNEKINLTSITEENEVIEKHFYDSLLPTKEVKFQKGAYLDMGTGAGFPGMVIAIAHPELYVTLADSTKKKFIFLQAVKDACGVKNVSFQSGRVEEMRTFHEHYDYVSARGFSALPNVLELGLPLLKIGGILISYKGSNAIEELRESERALKKLGGTLMTIQKEKLPTNGDERQNIIVRKSAKTPSRFPRSWAEISKRHL